MRKKVLILYSSRTGFTKRYAQWLGEDLDAPCIPLKDYQPGIENDYDVILCGGGIFGSELEGLKKYRKIQKRCPVKELIFFATGLRPVSDRTTQLLLNYNFGDRSQPKLYYFQGGLDLEHLDQKQQAMLTAVRAMLSRRRDLLEDDKKLLELLRASGDYCDRMQTQQLIRQLTG